MCGSLLLLQESDHVIVGLDQPAHLQQGLLIDNRQNQFQRPHQLTLPNFERFKADGHHSGLQADLAQRCHLNSIWAGVTSHCPLELRVGDAQAIGPTHHLAATDIVIVLNAYFWC